MVQDNNPNDSQQPKFSKEDYESLKKVTDLLKSVGALKSEIKDLDKGYEKFLETVGDTTAIAALQQFKDQWENLNRDLEGSITLLRNAQLEYNLMSKIGSAAYSKLSEEAKRTRLSEDERKVILKEVSKTIGSISSGYNAMREELNGIETLSEKELENIAKKAEKDKLRLEMLIRTGGIQGKELQLAKEQVESAKDLRNRANERLASEEKISKLMGVTGSILKGSQSLLSKFGLDKFLDLDKTNKKLRDMSAGGASPFQVMNAGAMEVGKSLMKAVQDPLVMTGLLVAAVKSIASAALDYEKKMFEAAKDLGVNVERARELEHSFVHTSAEFSKMGLSGEQLRKTVVEMQQNLGVVVDTESEFLAQSAAITRNLGLSAQQFELVQLSAKKNNTSVKESYASIIGTGKAAAANLKISMTEKQILEGISKTSATVFMNFKGNTQQLTEAVVKATKFGVTLDQINSAGSSMLDFQSSISKEFEAQLLTGKNINLQKAREYALTGQTDKLMDEITKNLGNQNQWSKMNVLQQQSLAEAMGMSKEQVDEMYRKQTLINELGKDAGKSEAERYKILMDKYKNHEKVAEIMGEEAAKQAAAASAQQQLTAAMENMGHMLASMAEAFTPITKIVSGLANGINMIVNGGTAIKTVFGAIAGIFTVMVARSMVLSFQATRQLVLAKQRVAQEQLDALLAKRKTLENNIHIGQELRQRAMKSINARIDAAGAAARVTAGSGFLGPGALAVGAIALTTLLGWLGSAGGEGGSGGGASSASTSAPPMESSGRAISPTNPYAASARMQTMIPVGANGAPIINNNINVEMDQFTNKKMVSVNKTQANGFDGQTGSNAQEKTVRRTGGS